MRLSLPGDILRVVIYSTPLLAFISLPVLLRGILFIRLRSSFFPPIYLVLYYFLHSLCCSRLSRAHFGNVLRDFSPPYFTSSLRLFLSCCARLFIRTLAREIFLLIKMDSSFRLGHVLLVFVNDSLKHRGTCLSLHSKNFLWKLLGTCSQILQRRRKKIVRTLFRLIFSRVKIRADIRRRKLFRARIKKLRKRVDAISASLAPRTPLVNRCSTFGTLCTLSCKHR